MNEYVNNHLDDVMFILLDKLARLKNVDFTKVNNDRVAKVVRRLSYDILVTYHYVFDGDEEQINSYLVNDLSVGINGTRWTIMPSEASLTTPDGMQIKMKVANEETLEGLVGTLSAITPVYEIINAEESETSTFLSVKKENEEYILKNGSLTIIRDGEETSPKENIGGINKLIAYSRNLVQNVQPVSRK